MQSIEDIGSKQEVWSPKSNVSYVSTYVLISQRVTHKWPSFSVASFDLSEMIFEKNDSFGKFGQTSLTWFDGGLSMSI